MAAYMPQKRALILFIFIIGFSFPVFSEEEEGEPALPPDPLASAWGEYDAAFGLELGNFVGSSFDGTDKVETEMSSYMFHIDSYRIWNESKFGYFYRLSLGLTHVDAINENRPGYIDYDGWRFKLTVGPLFKHTFNEKWGLFFGAGLNFSFTGEQYAQYAPLTNWVEDFDRRTFNLGADANIELQWAIPIGSSRIEPPRREASGIQYASDKPIPAISITISFGFIFNYDFFSYAALKSSARVLNTSGRVSDFYMFGVCPYMSVGFRS